MCLEENCYNKVFYSGKCLKHYRYKKYGKCILEGCFSPAMGKSGICDNCSRRGAPKKRHIGKHINNKTNKYCEGCSRFLSRENFYIDRGNTAYLCKQCHYNRKTIVKRRIDAFDYGIKNVIQTSAHLCVKCWNPLGAWEADHIIPYSLGGTHEIDNLQIMCISCNRKKSNNESIDYREFINQS